MNQSVFVKEIEGVKVIRLYDGNWYCNFTDYKVRQLRQRGFYSADTFRSWCVDHGLHPIM